MVSAGKHAMIKLAQLKWAILLLVLVLCSSIVWMGSKPSGPPKISITLLGYTNDNTSGALVARFAVSNLNPAKVLVYRPLSEIPAPGKPGGFEFDKSAPWANWNSTINSDASAIFTCPVPTNRPSWRVSFLAYPDVGPIRTIKTVIAYSLLTIHLDPHYQTMPYEIRGDWIERK
ncbi:MAG: hypothetical protein JWM68_3059 [Verrucomicrobiales bacterium]|nr:hypothetical protein [Verrucomicrobiales bacterium]